MRQHSIRTMIVSSLALLGFALPNFAAHAGGGGFSGTPAAAGGAAGGAGLTQCADSDVTNATYLYHNPATNKSAYSIIFGATTDTLTIDLTTTKVLYNTNVAGEDGILSCHDYAVGTGHLIGCGLDASTVDLKKKYMVGAQFNTCAYIFTPDLAHATALDPDILNQQLIDLHKCAEGGNVFGAVFCVLIEGLVKTAAAIGLDATGNLDNDSTPADHDECPFASGSTCTQNDPDNDGRDNAYDNCPHQFNPSQYDADKNGKGDACDDPDLDGDGILNSKDNCPNVINPDQTDTNGNGTGDACDTTGAGGGSSGGSSGGGSTQCKSTDDVYLSQYSICCPNIDADGDTIIDCIDNCVNTADPTNVCATPGIGKTPAPSPTPTIPFNPNLSANSGGGSCALVITTDDAPISTKSQLGLLLVGCALVSCAAGVRRKKF